MTTRSGRVDLHTHSTVSDGTLAPARLVELAAAKGLVAIALTDHDHLGGLEEARRAGERLGVEVISGVELSLDVDGEDVHMLGYLVDPAEPRLAARLAEFRRVRETRGQLIIERLQALGVDIRPEEVPAAESFGRPHIARVLVDKGIVASVQEAFDLWLADDRPAFVPKAKIGAEEAIALVHGAGGVTVIAHPGLLSSERSEAIVRELARLGLDGIEVDHSRHTPEVREHLRALCGELRLLATGGSDFHGENKPDVELGAGRDGNVQVSYAVIEALRARAASR